MKLGVEDKIVAIKVLVFNSHLVCISRDRAFVAITIWFNILSIKVGDVCNFSESKGTRLSLNKRGQLLCSNYRFVKFARQKSYITPKEFIRFVIIVSAGIQVLLPFRFHVLTNQLAAMEHVMAMCVA